MLSQGLVSCLTDYIFAICWITLLRCVRRRAVVAPVPCVLSPVRAGCVRTSCFLTARARGAAVCAAFGGSVRTASGASERAEGARIRPGTEGQGRTTEGGGRAAEWPSHTGAQTGRAAASERQALQRPAPNQHISRHKHYPVEQAIRSMFDGLYTQKQFSKSNAMRFQLLLSVLLAKAEAFGEE